MRYQNNKMAVVGVLLIGSSMVLAAEPVGNQSTNGQATITIDRNLLGRAGAQHFWYGRVC